MAKIGGKALDAPGYDLTGVFVGSEGTLGICTEVVVRIVRLAEGVKTMLAIYDSIEEGSETVSAIVAAGMVPATLEMMDQLVIKAVEESIHCGLPLDCATVLIIEVDGLKDDLERQVAGHRGPVQGARRARGPGRQGRRRARSAVGRAARRVRGGGADHAQLSGLRRDGAPHRLAQGPPQGRRGEQEVQPA